MKKQTAVEWLFAEYINPKNQTSMASLFLEALQMEKEQIMTTAWHCHIEGVKQSSKTSQEYIQYAEQYYNQTYGDK
jgi:hypothetical protein